MVSDFGSVGPAYVRRKSGLTQFDQCLRGTMMTRKVVAGWFVCVAVASGLATRTILGQGQSQATAEEFQQQVLPVVSRSCMSCHNDRSLAGTLSLEPFKDPSAALGQPAIWHKVLEK